MKKRMIKVTGLLLFAVLGFMMVSISSVQASSNTIPKSFRHNWYQSLENISDPMFIKFKTHSMDSGSNGFHHKVNKADLEVIKQKKGWYKIGYRGIGNPAYKVTKRKVNGKKRTVLLKKNSPKSHYAGLYVIGKKVKLHLGDSEVFLG